MRYLSWWLGLLCMVGACSPSGVTRTERYESIVLSEINEETTRDFANRFAAWAYGGVGNINILVNSPGGGVDAGMHLIQTLEFIKRDTDVKVTCYVDFKAWSMAFAFTESSVCDTRLMTRRALVMTHLAWSNDPSPEGQIRLEKINRAMAELVCARSKRNVDEYLKRIAAGEWWMTWEEAIKEGFIDAVVLPEQLPVPCAH